MNCPCTSCKYWFYLGVCRWQGHFAQASIPPRLLMSSGLLQATSGLARGFCFYPMVFLFKAEQMRHQGNSRAGHTSKSSSWGQQPLYLLQNRNMVLVPSKSCFLHPYGRQHEQSTALPKASHPAVCMEELNSSPACIAPWQLVLESAPLTLVTF